jgi:hypothetical protein
MTGPGLRDRLAMGGSGARGGAGSDEHRPGARGQAVPPPAAAELARMLAEFHARGGAVTICPSAYVLPVQGGAAA